MYYHLYEGLPAPVLRWRVNGCVDVLSLIDDMKLAKKLIGGFMIVLLIMAVIAVYGYTSAQMQQPI